MTTEEGAFAEAHPFMDLFGTPGRTKVLAAFVGERGREITVSYAAQLAGVSRSTVYNHLDTLKEMGVINASSHNGNPYYTLNEESDLGRELYRLEGIALKAREQRASQYNHGRSRVRRYLLNSIAAPCPKPTHSVAIPRSTSRFSISWRSVTGSRAPLAPSGWPMAIAPPLTL